MAPPTEDFVALFIAYAVFGVVACFISPYQERAEYFWSRENLAPWGHVLLYPIATIIVTGWWWWMWGGGESISLDSIYGDYERQLAYHSDVGVLSYLFWSFIYLVIYLVVIIGGGLIGWAAFLVSLLYFTVGTIFILYYLPWLFVIAYRRAHFLLVPHPGQAALKRAVRKQSDRLPEEVAEAMIRAHRRRKKRRPAWKERQDAMKARALAERLEAETEFGSAFRNFLFRFRK